MKRRTKIATILTTGLLSAALVGVGFAAWTISSGETSNAVNNGSISVVEVNAPDKEFNVSSTDATIKFGGYKTGASGLVTTPWLKYTETDDDQDLSFDITITLKAGTFNGLTVAVTGDTGLSDLVSGEYITGPTYKIANANSTGAKIETASTGAITFDGGSYDATTKGEGTIVVTVEFGWGARFNNENPYLFYNTQEMGKLMSAYSGKTTYTSSTAYKTEQTQTNTSVAYTNLDYLYDNLGSSGTLSGVTFTYTAS